MTPYQHVSQALLRLGLEFKAAGLDVPSVTVSPKDFLRLGCMPELRELLRWPSEPGDSMSIKLAGVIIRPGGGDPAGYLDNGGEWPGPDDVVEWHKPRGL